MEVWRSGAERFHGWTELIKEKTPKVGWDEKSNSLLISLYYVRDVYQANVSYDYRIQISIAELGTMLQRLSEEVVETHPEQVHEALQDYVPSLIRVLACASGHAVTSIGTKG